MNRYFWEIVDGTILGVLFGLLWSFAEQSWSGDKNVAAVAFFLAVFVMALRVLWSLVHPNRGDAA